MGESRYSRHNHLGGFSSGCAECNPPAAASVEEPELLPCWACGCVPVKGRWFREERVVHCSKTACYVFNIGVEVEKWNTRAAATHLACNCLLDDATGKPLRGYHENGCPLDACANQPAPTLHCSCGATVTETEYAAHRAMGHDSGKPATGAKCALCNHPWEYSYGDKGSHDNDGHCYFPVGPNASGGQRSCYCRCEFPTGEEANV